jgi:hypothetical protein
MHILAKSRQVFQMIESLQGAQISHTSLTEPEFLKAALKSKNDFIIVEVEALSTVNDSLLAQLNTYTAMILLYQQESSSKLQQLLEQSSKAIALHHFPLDDHAKTLLTHQLEFLSSIVEEKKNLKQQMIKFSEEIDFLVQSAEGEMLKAKRIHESVVPKRVEEFKGITLMSKYAVGSGAGSEYFDLIRGSHHSHLIIIHTSSYLASSSLMGIINKYKGENSGLNFDLFMNEAEIELQAINANKKKPVRVEMFLMTINNLDLSCSGYSYGSFDLISRKEPKALPSVESFSLSQKARAYFEFQLTREEKVIVFSPGFIFNWKEQLPQVSLKDFTLNGLEGENGDLLVELFFQLKKKLKDDFLSKDATAIVMEVKRHAIQKV